MRFLANKSELLPLVRRLNLVVGKRFLSEEKACILMEADEKTNTVIFTASGEHCALQLRHACRVEQVGKALLFGGVLQNLLGLFRDEATTVETLDNRLVLRNATTVYEFALRNADKYPKPPQPAPERLVSCADLPELASKVLFSAAGEQANTPSLSCVHLVAHDGAFQAETCDGFRLTLASQPAAADEPIDLLLPGGVMKTLLAILRGVPARKLGTADGTILCLAPGMIFTAERPQVQYLDLQKIVQNVRPEQEIEVDGDAFYTELSRVGVGSREGARVVLQSGKDSLALSYTSGGKEPLRAQSELAANVLTPLPAAGVCYSYRYLMDAAKLIRGHHVTLQFDKMGYLRLQTAHEEHVLLPMRMPKAEGKTKTKKPRKSAA